MSRLALALAATLTLAGCGLFDAHEDLVGYWSGKYEMADQRFRDDERYVGTIEYQLHQNGGMLTGWETFRGLRVDPTSPPPDSIYWTAPITGTVAEGGNPLVSLVTPVDCIGGGDTGLVLTGEYRGGKLALAGSVCDRYVHVKVEVERR